MGIPLPKGGIQTLVFSPPDRPVPHPPHPPVSGSRREQLPTVSLCVRHGAPCSCESPPCNQSIWLPFKCRCYCSYAVVGPWLNTGKTVLPLPRCPDLESERRKKGADSKGWGACQERFHRKDNPWAETKKMSAYSSGILKEGTVWAKQT